MDKAQVSKIETRHGTLSSTSLGSGSPALLMIHGNSTNSTVFKHVFASRLSERHQLIAFDLPGHGASSDAPDPAASYTQHDYADAALAVLAHHGARTAVVFGWSLGGHVAMEMLAGAAGAGVALAGLVLVGSPPIPRGGVALGFRGADADVPGLLAFRETLSAEERAAFAHATAGAPFEDWMRAAVERTDGRARRVMFEAMAGGRDSDQAALVGASGVPIAVINGREEPYIRIEYIRTVRFGNLWRGECIEMPGLEHAPFWESPAEFQPLLDDFMRDVSASARA